MPDKYIFDLVPLGGKPGENYFNNNEVYYIVDGNRFLTNNNVKGSGGTPIFKDIEEPAQAQEWNISVDTGYGNCYKITSNADNRYLNEYGVFGTNQYYGDWNTYLLTRMGDKWSIQWTQSAAKNGAQFIVVSGDRLEAKNVSRSESYTVSIVGKNDLTSIEDITTGNSISFDGATITAGSGICHIALYSTDGRLVKESAGNSLPTNGIESGVYVAVASERENKQIIKIVVK